VKAIVVTSDWHVASTMGLCPEAGIQVEDSTHIPPNIFQETLYKFWMHFWTEFVPAQIAGAERVVHVINGDMIEGVHHRQVGIATNNLAWQEAAAIGMYESIPLKADETFMVAGSEAHSGPGSQSDQRIGAAIKATPSEIGSFHWQLWLDVDGAVIQFAHHIGVTSSAAYETSAPMREMVAGLVEAAQWGNRVPTVFVRSHRHRFTLVPLATEHGRISTVITPGWQLRTPYVERIDRMRMPQIGGVVLKVESGECQIQEKIYRLPSPQPIAV